MHFLKNKIKNLGVARSLGVCMFLIKLEYNIQNASRLKKKEFSSFRNTF